MNISQYLKTVAPFYTLKVGESYHNITHIERMSLNIDEDLLQGAYKEQYNKIKEQWELTRETSQLGIAVEIIDHEFKELYARIDTTLGALGKTINSSDFKYLKKTFKTLEEKKRSLILPKWTILIS